jgi:hypothetical protein
MVLADRLTQGAGDWLAEGAEMSSRGAIAALMVAALALGAAGCGGSAAPKAQPTTTTVPIHPATDRITAQGINLTAADLPGWQESPNPPDASNQSLGAKLSACAGGPAPDKIDVVDVSSANFSQGSVEVSSDVTMVRSHADGLADLHAIDSPKLSACVHSIAEPLLAKQLPAGTTLSKLVVSTFTPPESLPNAFGLRLGVTIAATQQGVTVSVPLVVNEIGFLVGRAELTLNETEKGKAAPVAVEAALIHTLYKRAQVGGAA